MRSLAIAVVVAVGVLGVAAANAVLESAMHLVVFRALTMALAGGLLHTQSQTERRADEIEMTKAERYRAARHAQPWPWRTTEMEARWKI